MGYTIRRVPKDWNHPKDSRGYYKPLYDQDYETESNLWKDGYVKFYKRGMDKQLNCEYWEYGGMPPDSEFYRPKWDSKQCTNYMLYENTSQGTPVSPSFENINDLTKWFYENQVSLFGSHRYNYLHCEELVRHTFLPNDVYMV